MRCWQAATSILVLLQIMLPAGGAPALAAAKKTPRPAAATPSPLDRVTYAVDGAESSHGANQAMWRADPAGPQGPMQVSEAAASDVGGGDRFDLGQNREIGRAYLAQLYRRYGNWPDALAAYNWGLGNLDTWRKAGSPAGGAVSGVAAYLGRVLRDSGLCGAASGKIRGAPHRDPDCGDVAAWQQMAGGANPGTGVEGRRFSTQLDKALRLAAEHAR